MPTPLTQGVRDMAKNKDLLTSYGKFLITIASAILSFVVIFDTVIARNSDLNKFTTATWRHSNAWTSDPGWLKNDIEIHKLYAKKCREDPGVPRNNVEFLNERGFATLDPSCTCMTREIAKKINTTSTNVNTVIELYGAVIQTQQKVYGDATDMSNKVDLANCKFSERTHYVGANGAPHHVNIVFLTFMWNAISLIACGVVFFDTLEEMGWTAENSGKWPKLAFEIVVLIHLVIGMALYIDKDAKHDAYTAVSYLIFYLIIRVLVGAADTSSLALDENVATQIAYVFIVPTSIGIFLASVFALEQIEYLTTMFISILIPFCYVVYESRDSNSKNKGIINMSIFVTIILTIIFTLTTHNWEVLDNNNYGSSQRWNHVHSFDTWMAYFILTLISVVYILMDSFYNSVGKDAEGVRREKSMAFILGDFIAKSIVSIEILSLVRA